MSELVKMRIGRRLSLSPLLPQLRTFGGANEMAASCHDRTQRWKMIGETTSNLNSERSLRGELIDELIFKITAFS
jgi:hypothetical protein